MTINDAADILYAELAPLGIDTVSVKAESWRYGPEGRKRTVFSATIFPGPRGQACEGFDRPTLAGAINAAMDAWRNKGDSDETGRAVEEPEPV